MLVQFGVHCGKHPKQNFDCTSCQGKEHRCLLREIEITLTHPDFPTAIVTRDDISDLFEGYQKRIGSTEISELSVVLEYGLCPIPLFTPLSSQAMELYSMLGGLGNVDYFKLQKYPAIYIQAVNIISAEMGKYKGIN